MPPFQSQGWQLSFLLESRDGGFIYVLRAPIPSLLLITSRHFVWNLECALSWISFARVIVFVFARWICFRKAFVAFVFVFPLHILFVFFNSNLPFFSFGISSTEEKKDSDSGQTLKFQLKKTKRPDKGVSIKLSIYAMYCTSSNSFNYRLGSPIYYSISRN